MNVFILHLETATKVCSVALSKNGDLLQVKETQEDGYSHGENLNVFIEEVLSNAQISAKDLSAVSVASGPGSYTGLRIGAATAKGLCYALDIPLIAIDSLTSLTELAKNQYPRQNLCALIDARRMEVYSKITSGQGDIRKEISADIIDEDSYEVHEPFVYFGDGAEKLKEVWENRSATLDSSIKCSALGQLDIAFRKYNLKEFEDVAYWEPFYLKDFIAGVKKK